MTSDVELSKFFSKLSCEMCQELQNENVCPWAHFRFPAYLVLPNFYDLVRAFDYYLYFSEVKRFLITLLRCFFFNQSWGNERLYCDKSGMCYWTWCREASSGMSRMPPMLMAAVAWGTAGFWHSPSPACRAGWGGIDTRTHTGGRWPGATPRRTRSLPPPSKDAQASPHMCHTDNIYLIFFCLDFKKMHG